MGGGGEESLTQRPLRDSERAARTAALSFARELPHASGTLLNIR